MSSHESTQIAVKRRIINIALHVKLIKFRPNIVYPLNVIHASSQIYIIMLSSTSVTVYTPF